MSKLPLPVIASIPLRFFILDLEGKLSELRTESSLQFIQWWITQD
jgi:hypothetical protein